MKKKIPDRKPLPPSYRLEECERFLKNLESENEMLDDHGHAIIGKRERQPNLEQSES